MPRDIPKQKRFRPFALANDYQEASAKDLSFTAEEIRELIAGEQAFLADTHVAFTYSLYERVRRQNFCDRILQKLNENIPVALLTNREAGFLVALSENR